MTENEAIKNLKAILSECTESEEAICYATSDDVPALEMAIKALEELKDIKSDGFTDDLLNMGFTKGYNKAIDDFANWLVEQGILGNRCISDGEITDYGKVYAKRYKEQLKEEDK